MNEEDRAMAVKIQPMALGLPSRGMCSPTRATDMGFTMAIPIPVKEYERSMVA